MGNDTETGEGRNDAGKMNAAIPTINKYLAELSGLLPENRYVFRGHADSKWKLTSTAYRRYNSSIHWKKIIERNRHLVDEAKNANWHRKGNIELKDIEMLAELRHYSAATALIDFTFDFLVALYFACQPIENTPNGKIFIVDIGDLGKFQELALKDKECTLEEILGFQTRRKKPPQGKKPELWYWEPRFEINNRLSSQKGVFIFGKDDIPCHQEIEILEKDKRAIRDELKTWFGIEEKRLFNDLPGFGARHAI